MKHMASGTIAFIGVLALAGCYSYNGEAINNSNYNTVQATPNFLVVKVGDSTQVIARLVNDNNNGAITDYTVGSVGAGILVHENPNYRPVFDATKDTLVPTGAKSAEQFYVVGTAVGRYTFTLTPTLVNTGISGTITAIVTPLNLGAALSKTSAAPGDTVVLTAPAGTVFSQTSAISFTVGNAPAIVSRSADSTKITFLAAPGDSGVVTVTKVGTIAAPALTPVSLVTTNGFNTAVPSPTVVPTTVSTTTPGLGTGFTATLGGGLRFLGSTKVFIGGAQAGVTGVSADSSTATITPMPGATGLITYTNVALSFLTSVPLALPGDKSITVGSVFAGPTDAGAAAIATASTVEFTGTRSTVFADGGAAAAAACPAFVSATLGGTTCRYYKITIPAAGQMTAEVKWAGGTTADMAVILLNGAGTACSEVVADDQGLISGTQGDVTVNLNCAESGNGTAPTAGAAYLVVVRFTYGGTAPPWYMVRFSQP